MAARIQVQSTQALMNLRANLIAYRNDAQDDLTCARQEIDSFWRWLGRLLVGTKKQIDRLEDEITFLEDELACCEDYCDDIDRALDAARDNLARKNDYRHRIEQHLEAIKAAGQAFLREASRLEAFLDEDLEHGLGFLRTFLEHLERYAAVQSTSPATIGSSAIGSPGAIVLADASLSSGDTYRQAELQTKTLEEGNAFFQHPRSAAGLEGFQGYKGFLYGSINGFLRHGTEVGMFPPETEGELAKMIVAMQAEFGAFSLDKNATVYRGVSRAGASVAGFSGVQVGDSIVDHAFVSTSLNPAIAGEFASTSGFVFRIHCVPGTSYIPLSLPHDGFDESELVLPPGTQFYVTGISRGSIVERASGNQTIFDVIPIPPGAREPASWQNVEMYAHLAWRIYDNEHQR